MIYRLYKFCFKAENLDGESLKYAAGLLQAEMEKQKQIKRSPYLNDIRNLYLVCDAKLNGPGDVVKQILASKVPFIKRIKKLPRKRQHGQAMIADISLPLKYMENKEKLIYLQTLRKAFRPGFTYFGTKKAPHPLFKFITAQELNIYKGMGQEGKILASSLKSEMKALQ